MKYDKWKIYSKGRKPFIVEALMKEEAISKAKQLYPTIRIRSVKEVLDK